MSSHSHRISPERRIREAGGGGGGGGQKHRYNTGSGGWRVGGAES